MKAQKPMLIALIVGLLIRGMIRDRKAGKRSCGGNCASCGACGGCSACGKCGVCPSMMAAQTKKTPGR